MSYSLFLTVAYLLFNTFCVLAYIPQITLYIKVPSSRQGLALSTWTVWLFGAVIEFLYALHIENAPWSFVAIGHIVACGIIVAFGFHDQLIKRAQKIELSVITEATKEPAQTNA